MLFRRHFTIMVVPDAQALLKRFHVRGGQIFGGIVGLAILACLAISSPLLLLWGVHESRELSAARAERQRLEARSRDVEQALSDMRQKLAAYEKKTEKLAYLAGLDVQQPKPPGGRIIDQRAAVAVRYDEMRSEAVELVDRGASLDRRIGVVESAMGRQTERLAHMPSLAPTRGLIGGGFGWRRDPFTGLKQFHRGLDICAPIGTPVRAPADGVVRSAERDAGYGNTLTIDHGDGIVTRYGHLSAFRARPGQRVHRGDVVALVGNTGRSTGSHVHYEVVLHGAAVDPLQFLPGDDLF